MTNFLEHLGRENDAMKATTTWITSLKDKGLIVRAEVVPELIISGKRAEQMRKLVGLDYRDAEEVLADIYIAGLPFNCEPLKKEPYIRAVHLDPDQTLIALRDKGSVKPSNSFREAIQYLSQLRQYGVNATPGTWEEVLAEEHKQIIDTPLKEIELCAASGRLIARCKPGWSEVHPVNSRYRLVGEWNDNPLLRKIIENYHEQGRFHFTDGLCDKCEEAFERD